MTGKLLLRDVANHFRKTITFDGTTIGAVGTVTVATVTGRVAIVHGSIYCSTSLTGASATIELGSDGNETGLVAQTTATDIDATDYWKDASPEAEVTDALTGIMLNGGSGNAIILTIRTAAVTGGVLTFSFFWKPIFNGGNLG